ncbi:MAG: sn-glycerol-3-phosphate ABC transporter ATP-binding protein UgpC [Ignavibacteria bacterium]|nr:sn-glycerol-3-phosphate ABC transporter ATP-binding protein UgpC [Ignavibacteria bacterium]
MAEVKLINVSKIYENNVVAVNDVTFTVEDKEFVVLVGPSGCGKTTTLRMIAGLEEISKGELYIDNVLVNNVPAKDRDIAMVFQNYALYPHMTVYENMAFGLKIRKLPKDEIKRRVEEAAKILGIENLLDRKPKQLSGGQRQRVAVGRAIVRKPKVFLFDEPLSNLDAKLRVQMRTEISKLHQRLEATMIYVTHDQTEAMTMGDRIVVMKDGIVQQIDTPLNLYNKPINKFVAGFIGSPAMNFIEGTLIQENGLKFVSSKGGLKFQLDTNLDELSKYINKKVIAGIRPEEFQPNDSQSSNQKIEIEVEVVEPMGNETFVYFNVDNIQFVARIPSSVVIRPNQKFNFTFDVSKVHFFDGETEKRIN